MKSLLKKEKESKMKKSVMLYILLSLFTFVFAASSSYYPQDLTYELKKMSSILYMSDYYAEIEQWENSYEYPLKDSVSKAEWDNITQPQAVSILWNFAQEDIPSAQCLLARCFFSGVGTLLDEEQSFYWFSKAAQKGYAPAMFGLARCYEIGYGVDPNEEIAKKFYQRASDAKYAPAMSSVAFQQNDIELLKEAAKLNHVYTLRVLADYLSSSQNKDEIEEALSYYKKGFDLKDSECVKALAKIYADGVLVDVDSSLSATYYYAYLQILHDELLERNDILNSDYQTFLPRAKSNNAWACDRIARVYKIGTDIIMPDMEQSIFWTKKSAEAGSVDSCIKLGDLFLSTDLGYPDYAEALYWYKKAYKSGLLKDKIKIEETLDEIYHNALDLNFAHNALYVPYTVVDFSIDDYKDIKIEEAENWINKRAAEGSPANVFLQAGMLFGITDEEVYSQCIKSLQQVTEDGFLPGWYELGFCYEQWFYEQGDINKALDCYKKILAEKLDSFVIEELSTYVLSTYQRAYEIYSDSSSEFYNVKESENLQEKIIQIQEMISESVADDTEENHFLTVEKNALADDIESYVTLGDFYMNGYGCKFNPQKALHWYEKAASKNNAEGLYRVALSYEDGVYRKADYSLLFEYLLKAVDAGSVPAMVKLGELYEVGECVLFDTIQSFYWFDRAFKAGYSEVQQKLNSYQGITSVQKSWLDEVMEKYQWNVDNELDSFNRMLEGANQNDKDAQYIIGYCYLSGIVVQKDITKAYEWFSKSAENGNTNSKDIISDWENVVTSQKSPLDDYDWDESDLEGSVQRVIQAAEQGDAQAQYVLGFCYLEGQGVEIDIDVSHLWFEKAASNGYVDANEILAQWDEIIYGK